MGGSRLIEDGCLVNTTYCRQQLCALVLGHYGPAWTLVAANRRVRVHSYYKNIAQVAGGLQVAHMSYVQHVERAIGENKLFALVAPMGAQSLQLSERDYPVCHA